jgi:hypothetical protein
VAWLGLAWLGLATVCAVGMKYEILHVPCIKLKTWAKYFFVYLPQTIVWYFATVNIKYIP